MSDIDNANPSAQWSEIDGNNTAPAPDGFPQASGQDIWVDVPANGRAIMGAVKRFWDRINGTVFASGSAGAYVYTPSNTAFPAAYVQGETYTFKANVTSTGSDTLNVNGLGALPLYKPSTSGPIQLAAGDINGGEIVQAVYDGALNASAGGFHVTSGLSSTGNVIGPNSSLANDIPKFADATGKVLADGFTVGTAANNLVQLDGSGRLPAVDGSQLTNLPPGVPTGIISPYGGSSAPAGWLLCFGQAVSRTTYAPLFAVVGTTFGAGDGSTSFNVPDLRGRVAAGVDNMGGTAANRLTAGGSGISPGLGSAGGGETVVLTIGTMPAHNHGINDPAHTHGVSDPGHAHQIQTAQATGPTGVAAQSGQTVQLTYPTTLSTTGIALGAAMTGVTTQNNGGGNPHQNTQPTIELNYIIRT
jgi:microcystin-dependent protein